MTLPQYHSVMHCDTVMSQCHDTVILTPCLWNRMLWPLISFASLRNSIPKRMALFPCVPLINTVSAPLPPGCLPRCNLLCLCARVLVMADELCSPQGMVTLAICLVPTPGTAAPPHVAVLLQRWYDGLVMGGHLGVYWSVKATGSARATGTAANSAHATSATTAAMGASDMALGLLQLLLLAVPRLSRAALGGWCGSPMGLKAGRAVPGCAKGSHAPGAHEWDRD